MITTWVDTLPAVAVITALPAPTAWTKPVGDTVATDGAEEAQETIAFRISC